MHRALGRLDIVVANAGIWNADDLPIESMSEKQWDDMMRVNLKSVYSIVHFSVPQMIKQKSGKIIPITSTAGQRGEVVPHAHGAAKAVSSAFVGALDRARAAQYSREFRSLRMGGHGHVQSSDSNESRSQGSRRGNPLAVPRPPMKSPVNPLPGVGVGQLPDGEIINVNGGSVLCG